MKTCRECHGTDHVHRGLCRTCRERDLDGSTPVAVKPSAVDPVDHPPALEPPHSRPWIHRGGG